MLLVNVRQNILSHKMTIFGITKTAKTMIPKLNVKLSSILKYCCFSMQTDRNFDNCQGLRWKGYWKPNQSCLQVKVHSKFEANMRHLFHFPCFTPTLFLVKLNWAVIKKYEWNHFIEFWGLGGSFIDKCCLFLMRVRGQALLFRTKS